MPWVSPGTPLRGPSIHIAVGHGLRSLVESKALGIECDRCSFETRDSSPGTLDSRLHLVRFGPWFAWRSFAYGSIAAVPFLSLLSSLYRQHLLTNVDVIQGVVILQTKDEG